MYHRNYALLIILTQAKMSEVDYSQWLVDNHALKPANPTNSTAIEVMQGTADLIGLAAFGKLVWNIGAAVKNSIWSSASNELGSEATASGEIVADSLTEPLLGDAALDEVADIGLNDIGNAASESIVNAATDAGLEAGSEAAIDATGAAVADASIASVGVATAGLAIVAAIGIDAILGAIEGAKEAKELDKSIANLNKALNTTQDFSAKVNEKTQKVHDLIIKQQGLYATNIELLNKIQAATFSYQYDATNIASAPSFLTSMADAVAEYGWLPTIRTNYGNYIANGNTGWPNFTMLMEMIKPQSMSKQTADQFLDYAQAKLIQSSSSTQLKKQA